MFEQFYLWLLNLATKQAGDASIFLRSLERLWIFRPRPSVNRLTIEVTLKDGVGEYPLDQYQRLNNTRLRNIIIPDTDVLTGLTESPTKKVIASGAAFQNAFLTLTNVRSEAIIDKEPLGDYIFPNNLPGFRYMFDNNRIDWTKSNIMYPSNTIPAANDGKSILIIVEYEDLSTLKKEAAQ